MTTSHPSSLSDAALLAETVRAASAERRATADLVELLAEVDARRLYLGQGYSSLFAWCTAALRLSEPAAYSRITAARAARRYPVIFARLVDGDVTLTTVTQLAAHLTDENHQPLLEAARGKSKRDVERLVASLVPQPDIASSLRRIPARAVKSASLIDETLSEPALRLAAAIDERSSGSPLKSALFIDERAPAIADNAVAAAPDGAARLEPLSTNAGAREHSHERPARPASPSRATVAPHPAAASHPAAPPRATASPRAVVAPLASDRYLLKITLSAEARANLDRARDLLRHVLPSGDPAHIVERALAVLVDQLETSKCAAARRPQGRPRRTTKRRHVPAAVKRVVWTRDDGRCAFVGTEGRCRETGWLELHHVVPFARGGATTVGNLELRCRAHNAYEAERDFGARGQPVRSGRAPRLTTTLSGQSWAGAPSSPKIFAPL